MVEDCNESTSTYKGDWFTRKPNDGSLDTTDGEETEKATAGTGKVKEIVMSV